MKIANIRISNCCSASSRPNASYSSEHRSNQTPQIRNPSSETRWTTRVAQSNACFQTVSHDSPGRYLGDHYTTIYSLGKTKDGKAQDNIATESSKTNVSHLIGAIADLKLDKDEYLSNKPLPSIRSLQDLDENLPDIAESIIRNIGTQYPEKTYQNCLSKDLKGCRVDVDLEVEFSLSYKNEIVGSRRIDMLIETAEDEKATIEVNSVGSLKANHFKQLYYYMAALGVSWGYLVNFPGTKGKFPDLSYHHHFSYEVLNGSDELLSQLIGVPACSLKDSTIQIVKVLWRFDPDTSRALIRERNHKAKVASDLLQPAITQKGTLCKICLRVGRANCRYHEPPISSSMFG